MTIAADKILLARLLGECHALWLPLRTPTAPCWAAIWETRRRYPQRGLPWWGQGDKEQARALTALVQAGLVRRARGKAKTVGVILTAAGVLPAGALVGFGPYEAACFTAELLKHGPAGCWIPEIALSNGVGWGDGRQAELVTVGGTALQALASGFVESHCDIYGRVGYRVAETGVAAVTAWDGSLPEPLAPEPAALDAYRDGFHGGLARLQALPALPREIGEIPLAVATWAAGGCPGPA